MQCKRNLGEEAELTQVSMSIPSQDLTPQCALQRLSGTVKKTLAILFVGWSCMVTSPAFAGLFTDEDAQKKIQLLEARISKLEDAAKKSEEARKNLDEASKQQSRSMLDLLSQIETQLAEMRKLRGQNEELTHSLQEAKQRQKDFYVDLDVRLRNIETAIADATKEAEIQKDAVTTENRAYEGAHALLKTDSYPKATAALQEFLKKYPNSVHVPSAHFDLGEAAFQSKDYKRALFSYQQVVNHFSQSPKAVDAYFRIADSHVELKERDAAKATLKKIVAKYPGSEAAEKARKRLASLK